MTPAAPILTKCETVRNRTVRAVFHVFSGVHPVRNRVGPRQNNYCDHCSARLGDARVIAGGATTPMQFCAYFCYEEWLDSEANRAPAAHVDNRSSRDRSPDRHSGPEA